jgi:nucleotide-binding universal stress UspA family protein
LFHGAVVAPARNHAIAVGVGRAAAPAWDLKVESWQMITIAHAAALTTEDREPFAHCALLARASGAKLVSVHAAEGADSQHALHDGDAWLKDWGLADSVQHERMVHHCCEDPVDTTLDALKRLMPDLVVTGTHQRAGILRLLVDSRAEAIAQNTPVPTLVVPIGKRGFIEGTELRLRRIVVPVGDEAAARKGCAAAKWFLELAGATEGALVLLHVGSGALPDVAPELPEGWRCERKNVDGDVDAAIIAAAGDADLVVMATRGRDSIADVLVGSHTERVFHRAPCPVLSVHLE